MLWPNAKTTGLHHHMCHLLWLRSVQTLTMSWCSDELRCQSVTLVQVMCNEFRILSKLGLDFFYISSWLVHFGWYFLYDIHSIFAKSTYFTQTVLWTPTHYKLLSFPKRINPHSLSFLSFSYVTFLYIFLTSISVSLSHKRTTKVHLHWLRF